MKPLPRTPSTNTSASEKPAETEPKKVSLEEMLSWPKGTKLTDFQVEFPPEKNHEKKLDEISQEMIESIKSRPPVH
jgi:hypothetical protein